MWRLGKYLSSLTKPELEELKDQLNLTDDEMMVFEQLSKGRSRIAIADNCQISERTVSNKSECIVKKLERLKING
jgi:DNA-binding NarL/FixJ family response regulator